MKRMRPRKRWGQNFLKDRGFIQRIIEAPQTGQPRLVIEIGPGKGAITDGLIKQSDHYIGIEIDPMLAEKLLERYGDRNDFQLLQDDILDVNIADLILQYPNLKPVVIGNIPYNITSPILFKLFDNADIIEEAIIMMQKEVGQRLHAKPATKDYGLLAINGQLFSDVEYLFTVPAGCFYPKPKVDSAVLRFIFKKGIRDTFSDFGLFRKLIRHCFQQRRKMLRKSLSGLLAPDLIGKLDIDLTLRPERLSIDDWRELSESVYRLQQEQGA